LECGAAPQAEPERNGSNGLVRAATPTAPTATSAEQLRSRAWWRTHKIGLFNAHARNRECTSLRHRSYISISTVMSVLQIAIPSANYPRLAVLTNHYHFTTGSSWLISNCVKRKYYYTI